MAKKYITKEMIPELSVINTNTGEIVSAISKTVYHSPEDFIMCFLQSIDEISKLDGNTIRTLMWCWRFSSFDSESAEANVIVNNRWFKERIKNAGGELTDNAIDRAVTILSRKGFLIKQCRGTYALNPKYFFKGNLSTRSKLIRTIEYNPNKDKK